MNDKIRALIFKPDRSAKEVWISPNHESLVNIVGGEVTVTTPFNDGLAVIQKQMCSDYEMEPTCYILNNRAQIAKRFFGTVLVTGMFVKAGELDSLTDKEIRYVLGRMKRIEPVPERRSV